jgi:hypothetical protein
VFFAFIVAVLFVFLFIMFIFVLFFLVLLGAGLCLDVRCEVLVRFGGIGSESLSGVGICACCIAGRIGRYAGDETGERQSTGYDSSQERTGERERDKSICWNGNAHDCSRSDETVPRCNAFASSYRILVQPSNPLDRRKISLIRETSSVLTANIRPQTRLLD